MFKLATCFLLVSVTLVLAEKSAPGLFAPEDACNREGGMCIQKGECPEGLLAQGAEDLCPKQKHLGAACCHGLPKSWTGCQQRGGECMASCPEQRTLETNDCQQNTKCCVLV